MHRSTEEVVEEEIEIYLLLMNASGCTSVKVSTQAEIVCVSVRDEEESIHEKMDFSS